jgi:HTH-type transcriptional regulator / antitoxin HigA
LEGTIVNPPAFLPNWASPPGDTIRDILGERLISVPEFARLTNITPAQAIDLLEGRSTISVALARSLAQALGASIEFWMTRDLHYREDSERLYSAESQWLREIPVRDMARFGWLGKAPKPPEEAAACLAFFGQPSVAAWRAAYAGLNHMAAFRTSPSFDSAPGSVAAWLRKGEIEAARVECAPWDSTGFQQALYGLRALTKLSDPSRFLPKLQAECAAFGVAVVIVRSPSGCRASGVVRFLAAEKALLQLSFRYLSDDQLWFTFFHEAGHLLLHREKIVILEGTRGDSCGIVEGADTLSPTDEAEADDFAQRVLIPSEFKMAFETARPTVREVVRLAVRLGISPGIVVGQLQHAGKLGHNQFNVLKRRYRWS